MALADVMPLFDPVVVLLAAPLVAWALMAVYWIMNKREAYAKRLPSAKGILGELKKRDGKATESACYSLLIKKLELCYQGRAVSLNADKELDVMKARKLALDVLGDIIRELSSTYALALEQKKEKTESKVTDLEQKKGETESKVTDLEQKKGKSESKVTDDEREEEFDEAEFLGVIEKLTVAAVPMLLTEIHSGDGTWQTFYRKNHKGSGYLIARKEFLLTRLSTGKDLEAIIAQVLRVAGGDTPGALTSDALKDAIKEAAQR
ncbi:hypothetical protein AAMO2058_001414100 [Amorphochlora amoebiformis]